MPVPTTTEVGMPVTVIPSIAVRLPDIRWINGIMDADNLQIGSQSSLESLSFSGLSSMVNSADVVITGNAALVSVDLSGLTEIDSSSGLNVNADAVLTELNLSALTTIGYAAFLYVYSNVSLAALSLPALVEMADASYLSVFNNAALTSLSLPLVLFGNGVTLTFSGNALDQASVDAILARAVASAGFLSGSLDLSGGTNAPPGVQGSVDAGILAGRGITVTTN